MAKKSNISISVIRRLPRYLRYLNDLDKQGVTRISSGELSSLMGLTASQIRQDLNCFGEFGQQGYGYNVELLKNAILSILGADRAEKLIIIGYGNLGKAIARNMDFENKGFELIAVFDSDPSKIGTNAKNCKVLNISELENFCHANKPVAAALCIPMEAALPIAKQLIDCGVRCFWNFSHCDIAMDMKDVLVENVHLGDSLMTLAYKLKNL